MFFLPLVLLLWGMIFYKIFYRGNDKSTFEDRYKNDTKTKKKDTPKDTFGIVANYRDPFLSSYFATGSHNPESKTTGFSKDPRRMKKRPLTLLPMSGTLD